MKLIGDKKPPHCDEFKAITIRWPVESKMPVIRGKWKRLPDGSAQATYVPAELAVCLMLKDLLLNPEDYASE
jgi:hypothetical protein